MDIVALYHTSMGHRWALMAGLILITAAAAPAHDIITTPITWDREISRIVYERCASCHHEGGQAFSLMTYAEARPWAVAIKEEVFERRMPPWGAVKGFGDFRNDKALTEEQLELIVDWEEGGAPEGDPKDIPTTIKFPEEPKVTHSPNEVMATADTKLAKAVRLDGLWPKTISEGAAYQVIAELPDGSIEPLIWLQIGKKQPAVKDEDYRKIYDHPYLLRAP